MTTAVQELMSSPPITCTADASLTEATALMNRRQIGSVVVTDHRAVVGILTERDLMRAAASAADPLTESVRRWMTADPDVLGLDDEVGAAWSGLTHHHYRHLPVVDDGDAGGRGLDPGPPVGGPDPAGRRSRRRRAPRPRRGGGGRDLGRRRPWPEGLLPLPAVLGHRPGRAAVARGRLAAALRRRAARPRSSRPASPPRWPAFGTSPTGWPGLLPSLAADRHAARRPPHRGLHPGSRARLAPDPRHRPRARCAPRPCACARWSPPPHRRPPHRNGNRTRSPPRTTSPTPPTTCGC